MCEVIKISVTGWNACEIINIDLTGWGVVCEIFNIDLTCWDVRNQTPKMCGHRVKMYVNRAELYARLARWMSYGWDSRQETLALYGHRVKMHMHVDSLALFDCVNSLKLHPVPQALCQAICSPICHLFEQCFEPLHGLIPNPGEVGVRVRVWVRVRPGPLWSSMLGNSLTLYNTGSTCRC